MRSFSRFLFAGLFAFTSFGALAHHDDTIVQRQKQVLFPSVAIQDRDSIGSGTVFFSDKLSLQGKEQIETMILTAAHVVETGAESNSPVQVGFVQYDSAQHKIGTYWKLADVVKYDKARDLAILRLHDHDNKVDSVAKIAPKGTDPLLMEHVWTVGSSLGHPRFPSEGILGDKDFYMPGTQRRYLTEMFVFKGGSGGGLFHFDHERGYELIGVIVSIDVTQAGMHSGMKHIEQKEEKKDVDGTAGIQIIGNVSHSVPLEIIQEYLAETGVKFF